MHSPSAIWVYLSASPLWGLTLTLVCYLLTLKLYRAGNHHPLLNPVGWSIFLIMGVLYLGGVSYHDYFSGAQFIHFLLGPVTVALAIPLFFQMDKLKKVWLPLSVALVVGMTVAGFSAYYIAEVLGASPQTMLSMIPKSVTAPVAMGIADKMGGLPTLTAVFVVMTGIFGAFIGTTVFKVFKIEDDTIKGVAMGVTAHGLGTARAFQVSAEMGAFAGLAMALASTVSAFILPAVLGLIQAH